MKRKRNYPVDKSTVRPYRIWNAKANKPMPYRYFAFSWTAIDACWKDIQWEKAGTTLEVFDITKVQALPLAIMTHTRLGRFERNVKPDFNVKHVKKRKVYKGKAKSHHRKSPAVIERRAAR